MHACLFTVKNRKSKEEEEAPSSQSSSRKSRLKGKSGEVGKSPKWSPITQKEEHSSDEFETPSRKFRKSSAGGKKIGKRRKDMEDDDDDEDSLDKDIEKLAKLPKLRVSLHKLSVQKEASSDEEHDSKSSSASKAEGGCQAASDHLTCTWWYDGADACCLIVRVILDSRI